MESDIRKYYPQEPVEALQFTQDSKDEILKRLEQHNVQYLESKAMADSGQLRNGQGDLLGQIGLDDWIVFEFDGSMRIMNNPTFKAHYRAGKDSVEVDRGPSETMFDLVMSRPPIYETVTLTNENMLVVATAIHGRMVSYAPDDAWIKYASDGSYMGSLTDEKLVCTAYIGDVLVLEKNQFSDGRKVHDIIRKEFSDIYYEKYVKPYIS
jgi:hypothetical protein